MRFNILIAALVATASLSVTLPLQAATDAYEATVVKVVQQVEWQRSETRRWQPAFLNTLLFVGDMLRTGENARAELQYGDGTVARIGSLSSLTIVGEARRDLRLDAGKVFLKVKKGSVGMRVITPGAVAAVTGTEFMVEFDPANKLTEVTVFEGSVNVTSDIGNLVRVLGGNTTAVPFKAPASAPVPIDNRKLEERAVLFHPLSVEATPAATIAPKNPSLPHPQATAEPETPRATPPALPARPEPTPTPAPVTAQPTPAPIVTTAPQPTAPPTPEAVPTAAPTPQSVSPDLKGQADKLLDPRIINGSPTTGRVKVIIE